MRRRIMASVGKALPYDAEVEWIASTSSGNFIDTKIRANTNIDIDLIIWFESVAGATLRFFGAVNSAESVLYQTNWSGTWVSHFRGGFTAFYTGDYLYNATKPNRTTYAGKSVYRNGVLLGNGLSNADNDLGFNYYIFTRNLHGTTDSWSGNTAYLASAEFTRSDEVLGSFIPVRFMNENGVSEGAMYDRVSGQLFRNAGTGAFIIGPDKTT